MSETKSTQKAPAKPKTFSVRAKFPTTFLINPFTQQEHGPHAVVLSAIDGWTQSQIDAGKLELC